MDLIIGVPTKPRESADPYNGGTVVALQPNNEEGSKSKVTLSIELCDRVSLPDDDAHIQIATTGSFDQIQDIYLIPHADGCRVSKANGRAPRSFMNKKIHNTISKHFAQKEELSEELLFDVEIVSNPTPEIPWALKLIPMVTLVDQTPNEGMHADASNEEPTANTTPIEQLEGQEA